MSTVSSNHSVASSVSSANRSFTARIQQALSATRLHTFSLFAAVNLSAASITGAKLFALSTIVQTLQWLWFPLATTAAFPWTSTYISWLRAIAKIARFDLYITEEDQVTAPLAVPIVLLVLVLLLYTAAIIICIQLAKIRDQNSSSRALGSGSSSNASLSATTGSVSSAFTNGRHTDDSESHSVRGFASRSLLLHFFTTALNWSTSFLFLPISALLIGSIRCSKQETSCFEGSHLAECVVGMVTLGLWIPLCVMYIAFKFPRFIHIATMSETQASSSSSSSSGSASTTSSTGYIMGTATSQATDYNDRAHNRVALASLIASFAVVTAFSLVTSSNGTSEWGLALGFCAVASIKLAAQLWYLPLVNPFAQALTVGSLTLLAWSGLCLMIALAYHDEEQVVGSVILLLGAPLVQALAQFILTKRKDWFNQNAIVSINDPLLVEVKLRLEQQQVQDVSSLNKGDTNTHSA